jgi:hypothetical protein
MRILTYMSIQDFIKTHEGTGVLQRFKPPRGQSAIRGLLLAPEAQKAMSDANSAIKMLGSLSATQAALERWVTGGRMTIRFSGKKPDGFLAKLDPPPDEVWEFRVTQPTVQVRALGRFSHKDMVVLTHMYTRGVLGKAGSSTWTQALNDCVSEWDKLFPGLQPHSGTMVSDYISKNYKEL